MPSLRIKRGTKAQVQAAGVANQLAVGEPYLITDRRTLAVGVSPTSFQELEPYAPRSPSFTYDGNGTLTRIDYSDGSYKQFSYIGGNLTQVDHVKSFETVRKTLSYTGSVLTSITESVL